MKRLYRTLLLLVMALVMLGTTVFATPASDKAKAEKELKQAKSKMTSLMKKINEGERDLVKVVQPLLRPKKIWKRQRKRNKNNTNP